MASFHKHTKRSDIKRKYNPQPTIIMTEIAASAARLTYKRPKVDLSAHKGQIFIGQETFCPNDKLSHRHFLGDKLSQMTKCPTFSPCDKLSQRQNVPFPPRRQNVPLMILLKNHCFTGIFRATNCPKVTKCPTFSPATKCPNLCTYAHESYGKLLGHFVASEKGYWDNLLQLKKARIGHIQGDIFLSGDITTLLFTKRI